MHPLSIEYQSLSALKPRSSNPRTHSEKQIAQIANAIQRFGFTNPIIVDNNNIIAAGAGRFIAATKLGLAEVPDRPLVGHERGRNSRLCHCG